MAYCGCRTCCGKLTWCFSILFLLAGTVGLALGLTKSVPCTRTLVQCTASTAPNAAQTCWSTYWTCTAGVNGKAPGLYFFLAVAGAACLFLSLLSCCCFCCQKNPRQKAAKKDQDQFIQGTSTSAPAAVTTDAATTGYTTDQYATGYSAYDSYPNVKPSVAHV